MIPSLRDVLSVKTIDPGEGQRKALVLCGVVDAFWRRKIGRDPERAAYTHRASGDGSSILKLPAWPIRSVTTLKVGSESWSVLGHDDEDTGQQAIIGDNGFWLEAREPYFWPVGTHNVQCTYSAGWDLWELSDFAFAMAMLVHLLKNEELRIGENQLNLGDMNIQQVLRNSKDYQFITEALKNVAWRP